MLTPSNSRTILATLYAGFPVSLRMLFSPCSKVVMFFGMIGMAKKNKVLEPVVIPYAVDMMHIFRRQKIAAQMLFHNPTMFKHEAPTSIGMPGHTNTDVTMMRPPTTTWRGIRQIRQSMSAFAMAVHKRHGVSFEPTSLNVLKSDYVRSLPTTTFTDTRWDLFRLWHIAVLSRCHAYLPMFTSGVSIPRNVSTSN